MLPDDILKLLHLHPFQPFRIALSDESSYDVRHPGMALVGPTTVHVGVPERETSAGTIYNVIHIALLIITKTEFIEDGAAAG